jgi:hypothetical protein
MAAQPLLQIPVPLEGPATICGIPLPDARLEQLQANATIEPVLVDDDAPSSPSGDGFPACPPRSAVPSACATRSVAAGTTAGSATASRSTTSSPVAGVATTRSPTWRSSTAGTTPTSSRTARGPSSGTPTSPAAYDACATPTSPPTKPATTASHPHPDRPAEPGVQPPVPDTHHPTSRSASPMTTPT